MSPPIRKATDLLTRKALHRSVVTLELIIHFLGRDDSDRLGSACSPCCIGTTRWQRSHDMGYGKRRGTRSPSASLSRLMDNASRPFPRASHAAAAALTLTVCRRPAVALLLLDSNTLIEAVYEYLHDVCRLVANSECIVEERYGVVTVMNILPLLYHLGDWTVGKASVLRHHLIRSVFTICVHFWHSASQEPAGEHCDRPPNLDRFPELNFVQVTVTPLLDVGEATWARPSGELTRSKTDPCRSV